MRKIVLFMHQSLDGYCATKEGGLEWIPYNGALQKYAAGVVETVGSPVYGRVTYELMKGYWPGVLNDPSADAHEKAHAEWIDKVEKIVFSTTMSKAGQGAQRDGQAAGGASDHSVEWNNTTVISDDVEARVRALKEQDGKDLVIFGSPTLARSLMSMNLIDEFRFTVCPIMLGEGLTFIRSVDRQVKLELLESEQIEGGIMALHYKVVK